MGEDPDDDLDAHEADDEAHRDRQPADVRVDGHPVGVPAVAVRMAAVPVRVPAVPAPAVTVLVVVVGHGVRRVVSPERLRRPRLPAPGARRASRGTRRRPPRSAR